ncbi:MAG: AAA family ATPase [Candidatus Omnitrophota bacterium]|nr:AAA family ATPase [Candidatus Omnitrophota bacterium]
MGYVIALAGKGGTGKTTIASLIIRLIKEKKMGSILAIDADPNSNLSEALAVETKETIADVLDEITKDPAKIPVSMPKDRFIEYKVSGAIQEADGFDILTMGRPEGQGCYCYVNNVLRNIMSKLIKEYDYIVIDNEAGLEHLSRRTTRSADSLMVISDATLVGLKAAKRIKTISEELGIKIKKNFLLINSAAKEIEKEKLALTGLEYLGFIPFDPEIEKASLNGNSLMDLKEDALSINALRNILEIKL